MISAVMGVYNGEKDVAEAVQSICRQTFRDFEFIIVDDGSTDGASEILRRHAAEDSRICLVSLQPNQGLVTALNRGCAAARGEFIARMDADDVSLPDRFEKQIGFLRMHPWISVLGDASRFIQDGVLLDLFEPPPLRHREILEVL
jgi:glycosyltransferase involved in cell wall biosynthesis